MISDDVLEQGIVRGIVTNQQVADLRALALELTAAFAPEPEDDEKLRFITGFNDVFVTLGLAMFFWALGYLALQIGPAARWPALALAAWLLAEFFTRRRRMALPSIVLLAVFAISVFFAATDAMPWLFPTLKNPDLGQGSAWKDSGLTSGAALLTVAMTALHYLRFRVPITIAAAVAASSLAIFSFIKAVAPELLNDWGRAVILLMGLGVFALAMRFDLSDPQRVTRRTDIAFWLHLLAAPLIVHPLISKFTAGHALSQVKGALAVLAMFLALSVVAVVIDRRAILVSGLAYAGYAVASLVRSAGLTDYTTSATVLALGAFVLLLSAGWRPVRTALLRLLPAHLAQRLPHPILSSS